MPANHLIARNVRVEVGMTMGTPVTVTGITKAGPPVVSATAHGFANGDAVVLTAEGMAELDGQIGRVANAAADSFELENADSTDFGTFTAGTVTKVATWATLAKVQTLEAPAAGTDRQDATVLLDRERQYVYGAPDTPEITANGLSDLNSASVKAVQKAARSNQTLNFRVVFNGQSESRLFRGSPTTPSESITVNTLVTSSFSVSQVKERMAYVDA